MTQIQEGDQVRYRGEVWRVARVDQHKTKPTILRLWRQDRRGYVVDAAPESTEVQRVEQAQ